MTLCKHGVDSREARCANCDNARRRKASLRTRKALALATRLLAPLLGHWIQGGCLHCGIHEAVVPFHTVMYSEGTGSSILCEGCWRDLPTSRKVEYYRRRYEQVYAGKNYGFTWEQIEMAVRHPYYWRNTSGVFLTLEEC